MRRTVPLFGLAALLLAFGFTPLAAQQTVTGTVTDASTGDPLPFVNILIQDTQLGAASDIEGRYSIEVPGPDAVLIYRYVGYVEQAQTVGSRSVINVELLDDADLLDEIVVVGYGTQRRGDVTSSVTTVDVSDANQGLVTAPTDFLEGRVAGLSVIETSGEPGANVEVRIRGGTSVSSTNQPLYVIDGIPVSDNPVTPGGAGAVSTAPAPNPLNLINPNDVLNVTVLKDASATAIYGSRGANGVILITTKKGREGQVTVDYEGNLSTSTVTNNYDLISAGELRPLVRDLNIRFPAEGVEDPVAAADAAVAGLGDGNSNFLDEVFDTAVSQQHNLSFSGGTSQTQYRASVGYLNQEGVVISSGLERLTGRVNANSQFLDNRLRLGLNLTSALTSNDFVPANATGGAEGGIFQNVIDFRPTLPVADGDSEDGFFEQGGSFAPRNPVALAEQIDEQARTTRTLGNVSAEFDLFGGLTANVNLGGDRSVGRRSGYFSRFSPVSEGTAGGIGGAAFQRDLQSTSITVQSYLTYELERDLNSQHGLNLTGGYEYTEIGEEEFAVQAEGFITDVLNANAIQAAAEIALDGGAIGPGSFSARRENNLRSVFGRANYSFDDRYYLTGILRYDGSSRVARDNRYELFPAVSVAWRLSEEAFLENVDVLSDLRLRAGYGEVGNERLSNPYGSLSLLDVNADLRAVLGGAAITGAAATQLANPDLRWERKKEFVFGLDYGLLAGRVFGSLDYYRNTTDNLLIEFAVPQPSPVPTQVRNGGEIRNTGLEFSLDAIPFQTDDASFDLGLTMSVNNNEILDLGGRDQIFTGVISGRGQSNQTSLLLTPGQSYPVFYGAEFVGLNEDGFPLYNDYEDSNGDGFNDQLVGTTIGPNQGDYQIIGDPRPDLTYGLRLGFVYKGVGIRAFLRGEQGRELFNNTALVYSSGGNALSGFGAIAGDFSAEENPRAAAIYSDRFVENASFLRLDQLTLDYAIPTRFFGSVVGANIRSARVFATGSNLFVITPYSGVDPEVSANAAFGGIQAFGIDYLPYPRARTFTVGVGFGL